MELDEELICMVVDAAADLDIDIMLIGAFSRDYWRNCYKITASVPTTMDIDFACQVMAWNDYRRLLEKLKSGYGLIPDARNNHKLWLREDIAVDFVPFGDVAAPNGEISWPPDYDTKLCVIGLNEAKNDAGLIHIGDKSIKIMRPHWFALLKLQSYTADTSRSKDLKDFYFIIDNYFDCIDEDSRLYGENALDADILEGNDYDTRVASATLIARDCLRASPPVTCRIMQNIIDFNKMDSLTLALTVAVPALNADMSKRILEALLSERLPSPPQGLEIPG